MLLDILVPLAGLGAAFLVAAFAIAAVYRVSIDSDLSIALIVSLVVVAVGNLVTAFFDHDSLAQDIAGVTAALGIIFIATVLILRTILYSRSRNASYTVSDFIGSRVGIEQNLKYEYGAAFGDLALSAPLRPRRRPVRTERYVNVQILSESTRRQRRTITPDEAVLLRVGIGKLDRQSLIERPTPFPDKLLPLEDVTLEVMLSSSDFAVGLKHSDLGLATVVQQRLRLPASGRAAVAEDSGKRYIDFLLRAPDRTGSARARLSYIYRNTVLQSQRLDAELGGNVKVTTDFTLSVALGQDVQVISSRPRVTVIANESPGEQHQLTVRAGDGQGNPLGSPVTFPIRHERIGPPAAKLRKELAKIAPKSRKRQRNDLVRDLRRLAPLGWDLYTALDKDARKLVEDTSRGVPDPVLQVALAKGSTFTLPWSFVYDIYLPNYTPVRQLDVCPIVKEWGDAKALVSEGARTCPHPEHTEDVEGLLCPFGFWGFRYSIELLTSTKTPQTTIRCAEGMSAVIGRTDRRIKKERLAAHVVALTGAFSHAGIDVRQAYSVEELRRLIEPDLPLIYFLCHGSRRDRGTLLSIGRGDQITPQDLVGWIRAATRRRRRRMWTDPRPLVFINACGSLAITPEDILDYLDAFVNQGHAAGVIGTEVKVERGQAMELAEMFFTKLFQPGATVEEALRHVRLSFLADGNLFGLVYTPYCFADLAVVIDPPSGPPEAGPPTGATAVAGP